MRLGPRVACSRGRDPLAGTRRCRVRLRVRRFLMAIVGDGRLGLSAAQRFLHAHEQSMVPAKNEQARLQSLHLGGDLLLLTLEAVQICSQLRAVLLLKSPGFCRGGRLLGHGKSLSTRECSGWMLLI